MKIIKYLLINFFLIFFIFCLFEIYLIRNQNISINDYNKNLNYPKKSQFYGDLTTYKNYKKEFGYKKDIYDGRDRYSIFRDLKDFHDEIKIYVTPNIFINYKNLKIFPLAGVSNSETIMCNEKNFYSIFKSDRFGFNNNDNIWEQDEIEYVLFGDSYVMGSCVDSEYNISSNLENFSKKEILNLGYAGAGPLIYLATMREYLPEVKINKIIFFWFEYNDPKDLSKELKNSILVKYLENSNFSQNLKSKQHKIDLMLNDIIDQEYKKMKPKLIKKISYTNVIFFNQIYKKISYFKKSLKSKKNFSDIPEIPQDPIPKDIEKILLSFDLKSKSLNSKLYFVYVPQLETFYHNHSEKNYLEMKKITSKLNIPFIDLSKLLFSEKEDPREFYSFGGHFNEKGYKKVAETVFKYISNELKYKNEQD